MRLRSPAAALTAVPIAVLLTFFIVPLGHVVLYSLRESLGYGQTSTHLTLANYREFFGDGYYRAILIRTLVIAVVVTGLCIVLGWPVARVISRSGRRTRTVLQLLIFIPLLTSAVVRTFGWILILAKNGFLNDVLLSTGLTETPVEILYRPIGVVVGMVHVLLPFMILTLTSTLDALDPSLEEAAGTLGSSPVRTTWSVVVPLAVPGLLAGSTLVFALTTSSFVTPALLGGLKAQTMATLAYDSAISGTNFPFASMVSVVLLVVTLAFVSFYYRWSESDE